MVRVHAFEPVSLEFEAHPDPLHPRQMSLTVSSPEIRKMHHSLLARCLFHTIEQPAALFFFGVNETCQESSNEHKLSVNAAGWKYKTECFVWRDLLTYCF